jgi:N-methylhydantoinase A
VDESRIGIDTGGTFTDLVAVVNGDIRMHKLHSTPYDPAVAVIAGMEELAGGGPVCRVIHGSTVATNALLERKGARVALLTTSGFEDVIEIGRQTRLRIYDLMVDRPEPLVDRSNRYGLHERVGPFGEVEQEIDRIEVKAVAEKLHGDGIEAVAVCFLNSYANPRNEQLAEEVLGESGKWPISVSYRVLPEYREYERLSTTVVNAYVSVLMGDYLRRLEGAIGRDALRIMQSNGGFISVERAAAEPVRTILSGPAGGVVGALEMGKRSGYGEIISFDMGGTSTDVCLCRGDVQVTHEAVLAGLPVRVPVMDVHTVGAGGGSIAWIDRGGALRVGPHSAGADPGPICYGRGEELTVTDAHLFLGRLEQEWFLDGGITLDRERVRIAMERLASRLGKSPSEMALGIIRVANVKMEGAIRVISLERGNDPRDFTLVTFGGAGALHACEIARDLSIRRVLIPIGPGALSALGMLMTDVVIDQSANVLKRWEEWAGGPARRDFERLEAQVLEKMSGEIDTGERARLFRSIDMRYAGQSYELNVPWSERAIDAFHQLHMARYGISSPDRPVEVVTVRVRGTGEVSRPELVRGEPAGGDAYGSKVGEKDVYFNDGIRRTSIYDRERLRPGNLICGPAMIVEYTATSLIPPGYVAEVDGYGNIVVEERG